MLNDVNRRKYFISNLITVNYILQNFGEDFIRLFHKDIPSSLKSKVIDISFQIYDGTTLFLDFKVCKEEDEEFMKWLDNYTDNILFDNMDENYTIVSVSLDNLYSFVKKRNVLQ